MRSAFNEVNGWTPSSICQRKILNIFFFSVELVSPGRNHEVIQEGSEPDEFWNGLGGKGEYSKTIHNMDKPILEPRLLQCLELNGGRFRALEIDDFDQKDLIPDSVLILDSGDEIYIWVGNEASDSDKENSLKLAKVNIKRKVALWCFFISENHR